MKTLRCSRPARWHAAAIFARPGLVRPVCTSLLVLFIAFANQALGFDKLTAAQTLVYDTAHLSNTRDGQTLSYRYHAASGDQQTVSDRVLMSVSNASDNDKRDVSLDFLSDDRHLSLPDFQGYRGNPVIIAMLEHIAQSMGRETGGGVIYFRNRIRDALAAETIKIAQSKRQFGDENVIATELSFSPFTDDPYLAEMPEYNQSLFNIVLSDAVPGGVLGVSVESRRANQLQFIRQLELESL